MSTDRAARGRLERAHAVSALVGANAAARDAFDAAYTGRGEALDALDVLLGNAADPDRVATLVRHRRSAFARPDGATDEAAAAAALVALRREEERSDADSAALDRAIDVVLGREAAHQATEHAVAERAAAERAAAERAAAERAAATPVDDRRADGAPASAASGSVTAQNRRWLRPVLAAAVIVAAIALGAVGANLGAGALGWPEPVDAATNPSPTPITYLRDPAARDAESTRDAEAADRWFRSEQTPEDASPAAFDDIDPGSTRVVHTGTDGWRVWVGRSKSSDYCLLVYSDSDGSGGSSCVDAEGFARAGAMISTGVITTTWTGSELTVTFSRR